jgi:mRNA interferase RelE/StbE
MYAIRFSKSANKAVQKLPKGVAVRLFAELRAIAVDPTAYRGDWKPLQGADNQWRLRVGAWRALCELRAWELVLLVVKVAARGDAHK